MSDATYRFLRTVNGTTYFALVSVHAEIGCGRIEAIALLGSPDETAGEVSDAAEPTWVEAAIAGALLALNHLCDVGKITGGCQLQITRLVGSVLDTREDVVECAAVVATLLAIDNSYAGIKPTFDGYQWRVELNS